MAKVTADIGGPAIADINAYRTAGNVAPAAFTIATVGGIQRIKATGAGTSILISSGGGFSGAWIWHPQKELRVSGTLPVAYEKPCMSFSTDHTVVGLSLWIVRQTDSTYKLRLKNKQFLGALVTIGTSTNTFNTDQDYAFRLEDDTVGNNLELKVGANIEIDTGTNYANIGTTVKFIEPESAAVTVYHSNWMMICSTTQVDRPGLDVEVKGVFPNGGGAVQEYGGEAGAGEDCTDTAKGLFSNWDEWTGGGTANNGDTDFNCLLGGNAGKELSTLNSVGIDTNLTVQGVMARGIARGDLVAKTIESYFIIRDDG